LRTRWQLGWTVWPRSRPVGPIPDIVAPPRVLVHVRLVLDDRVFTLRWRHWF
jgi:hypothetical protein